jgi:hypothetical protein
MGTSSVLMVVAAVVPAAMLPRLAVFRIVGGTPGAVLNVSGCHARLSAAVVWFVPENSMLSWCGENVRLAATVHHAVDQPQKCDAGDPKRSLPMGLQPAISGLLPAGGAGPPFGDQPHGGRHGHP